MLHPDPRAYRVALVADAIETAAPYDVVALLQAADFGMVVLPPSDFVVSTIASIVEYVVDDLVDYASKGYRVVVVASSALPGHGVWDDIVGPEIARRGLPGFERFDVAGTVADDFVEFLGAVVPPALV